MFEGIVKGRTAKRYISSLVHGQKFADDEVSHKVSNPLNTGTEVKGLKVKLLQFFWLVRSI